MATKPKQLKNPGANVIRHMDPAYPLRPLIDGASQIRATVLILPVPGKKEFVASTLEDAKILVSARTRKAAQTAAMREYVEKHTKRSPRLSDEDARDANLIRKARKERRVPWEQVKRQAGL